ncbi:fibrous sheath-interacting protein 1 isoform X2 [Emydura macquarii macquarii]|uniref:fibrous sheath-interacting protein 1 isoform X2 n=1 Tax=Emydura macquarii macquarii TaxID=1129001 RepID=UPI00352B101D
METAFPAVLCAPERCLRKRRRALRPAPAGTGRVAERGTRDHALTPLFPSPAALLSPPGIRMDITRGNLDEISRPASSSRAHPGSRALSASLEVLTPEPCLSKVSSPVDHKEDDSRNSSVEEDKDDDNEKHETKKMRTSPQTSEGEINCIFQQQMQSANERPEYVSSSVGSEDECTETQASKFNKASEWKLTNVKEENTEEKNVDPQIREAIKRMNKLDKILAKKQSRERAIVKQGREVRTKLWKELQSVTSLSASGTQEEIENTNKFLALTSSLQETVDPSHSEEDEIFISVFHTQINSEDYDCNEKQAVHDHLNETEISDSLNKTGKTHQKSDTRSKNTQDFIKKNIELAKDSGSQVIMLEEEKKRLVELLKDIEDNGSELQGIEENVSGWLIPGEGYTPEPMEYHHLNEIDAKLHVVLSSGDFSARHSSCSKVPSQIYQESLVYANRSLEAVPGEKALRDTREQREQQNRLKEINQQLKNLQENLPEELPCLSEGQLVTLLEECMQFPRTISNVTLPELQESLSNGISPSCYTTQDCTLLSKSTLSKLLGEARSVVMLTGQERAGIKDKSVCEDAESETCGYYLSKALADSHLSKDSVAQIEEPDDLESSQEMNKSNTEGYFMSRALSTKRLKKPSFLDELFYCISMNNELSTEADIPSIPLQTRGGAALNNHLE